MTNARSDRINVGVFLPNWIGDVVMATPTLRSLHAHFQGRAKMVGIMRPYVRDVLAGTPWLSDVIAYDRRSEDASLGCRSVVRQLREHQLDSVILLTNSLRSAALAWLARVPQRIGYVRYGRGPLLTEKLTPPRNGWKLTPISAVDYYLGIAEAMGSVHNHHQLELQTLPEDERRVDAVWAKSNFDGERPVVALNTGAAYGAAKEWPNAYFAQLATRLASEQNTNVIVVCGPSEREKAIEICQQANHPRITSLADQPLSIGLTKAVIRRTQCLVTTDSGPRHFGAAFRIPTVSLFGPTDPRWSHNFNARGIDLQRHVPCGPCAKRVCPLKHHRCMTELTVAQVYQATASLLTTSTQRAA